MTHLKTDYSLKEHQGTENTLEDVTVCTLALCISLCLVSPAEHIHAHVHQWIWPNATAFLLPDWVLLLTPSFLLDTGHSPMHTASGGKRQGWRRGAGGGGREHVHLRVNRALPISVIQFIYLVTFASIHWFTTYICVRASMCLAL